MICSKRMAVLLVVAMAALACEATLVHAQGNAAMVLDGMIVNNSGGGQAGWGGYGRFQYSQPNNTVTIGTPTTPGLGRYDAFTISEPGIDGSGVGVNFTVGDIDSPIDSTLPNGIAPVTANMFPLLDLGTFGSNFDPTQYRAELVYRPLPGNTATQLNMTLDTVDGFTAAGARSGEQHQWGFFDLVNTYNNTQTNGDLDADGFAVSYSNATVTDPTGSLSVANRNFTGQSYMYGSGNPTGDGQPDFSDFEGNLIPVPNGAVQIHLQTVYGTQTPATGFDNWEIKSLRIVKLNPNPQEVARLDGKSGFSQRFGSPFQRNFDGFININGVDYDPPVTDQLQRFDQAGFLPNGAFRINTDDSDAFGGIGVWQNGDRTEFDGNTATLEIRAKLTAPLAGQAESVTVIAKDRDGNGTGDVGDFGGEEYLFNVALNQFNETSMTTISIPFNDPTLVALQQAQEFATPGDNSLSNFNLYYLGMQTAQGAGIVDLEVEYVRVMLPAALGQIGDYNDDGNVDAADYTVWRNNVGNPGSTLENRDPANGDGNVGPDDYDSWKSNFGAGGGGSLAGNVPEPSALGLVMMMMGLFAAARPRR
jgi:hypothetical protein